MSKRWQPAFKPGPDRPGKFIRVEPVEFVPFRVASSGSTTPTTFSWNTTAIEDFNIEANLQLSPDAEPLMLPPSEEETFAAKMRRKRGEGAKEEQLKASMSSIEFGERIHQNVMDITRRLGREFRDPKSPLYGWGVGESQGGGKVSITPPDRLPNALQVDLAQARLHELMGC